MNKPIACTLIALALLAIGLSAQADAAQTEALDIFFQATGLAPEMEGTEAGQIVLSEAVFCPGGLCAAGEPALVRAFTEPFSDTVRVWVEYRAAAEPIIVSFKSQEGYGLGQCEITPAGTARQWGWCEHDPAGNYEATQVLVHFPAYSTVGGLVAARPGGWEAPEYQVFIPFVRR